MPKVLLSLHVLAVIVAIGPVAVAASMFPRAARRALAHPAGGAASVVRVLHRICRGYATLAIAVPVFGLATASALGILGDAWLITSIALTALAAGVLALVILPGQDRVLAALSPAAAPESAERGAARLAMYTGMFNVLWTTITVLMIVRPGSTTGV